MFKKNSLKYFVSISFVFLIFILSLYLLKNYSPSESEQNSFVITGQASYLCLNEHVAKVVFMTRGSSQEIESRELSTSNTFVSLRLDDDSEILLPQVISADGSRYSNSDESLVFWSKGNGAMILQNGREDIYQKCIELKEDIGNLSQAYLDPVNNFTLRYPAGYTIDDSYTYSFVDPGYLIKGTKLTIPASSVKNTNLSNDSYISVEHLNIPSCSPEYFLPVVQNTQVPVIEDGEFLYLVASSTDAGAGNRYEEYVYVIADLSPCLAFRYFIHYSVFENYPAGSVTEFDRSTLMGEFDDIRRSLIMNAQFESEMSLNADVYPLYENIYWQNEEVGEYGDMKGYIVSSEPVPDIVNISEITQPFEKFYTDLLTSRGWKEDISMAAGGPGSAVVAYKKNDEYIILQYKSEFRIKNENEPFQCPCSVQFSIFSGE